MIELSHVTKRFGATLALDDVSFAVRPGSIVGFLGPNGAGKSTALRCLVTVTFDHHLGNENYIRIVMSENINRGRYLAQSTQIQELNRPAITMLRSVDLSEPGDHGMAEISVDLAWRGETLTRTTIVADILDLRIIAVRP